MNTKNRICCIGAGYVGGPTMAVLASQCPDLSVNVVDVDPRRIAAWNSDALPIYEPGLDSVVQTARGRNLRFSTEISSEIDAADLIFISVNTPTKMSGVGAGKAANLEFVEKCARQIATASSGGHKIVVEKSTLPVRTADAVSRILSSSRSGTTFDVLSNPEFLAEGTAVADLLQPDRVLIGGECQTAIGVLADVYRRWVPAERVITTNLWSSELSKLTANAFLAQRVSSINAISELCEATGADVDEVACAIGMDSRIGHKFLEASIGFGGSCFQKDILNLVYLCQHFGLPEVADYWEHVVRMNDRQKQRFSEVIVSTMFNTVSRKKIAVWGFAFKKDTNDSRESPAAYICRNLLEERAKLSIYDPKVSEDQIRKQLVQLLTQWPHRQHTYSVDDARRLVEENVIVEASAESAAQNVHAIAILTEWNEFKEADYEGIYERMLKPAFIFLGRNIVHPAQLRLLGFDVHAVGKASASGAYGTGRAIQTSTSPG